LFCLGLNPKTFDSQRADGLPAEAESTVADVQQVFRRRYQHLLDRTVVYPGARWAGFAALVVLYGLRVYYLKGWYIVTYGLGIFLLNLFIGFLSPQVRA
jgi:hypothetical protein